MTSLLRQTGLSTLFVLVVAMPAMAQAESDSSTTRRVVEILNADSARATSIEGQLADMLIGNVALKQGETLLSASRAIRFKASDQIIFEGDVLIVDEGDTLASDRVVYESDEKKGIGTGNVRWSDGEVIITASLARYFVDDKIAEFERDVVMQDSTTTVLSLFGMYDVEERVASFHDDVYLEQRRLALTAEALTHERESGLTMAVGHVWINRIPGPDSDETSPRVLLVADTVSSERDSGMNYLTGSAGLVRVETNSERSDTLVVRSASVVVEFADSTETFEASENVRLWRGTLSGSADSLRYATVSDTTERQSTITMVGDPFVWSVDAQVNGDTVNVHAGGGDIRSLEAYPNAFAGFKDSADVYVQQLKGRRLEAVFAADSLKRLTLRPNAEALYFASDSTDNDKKSALRFTSTEIKLLFAGNEIDRITASDDVEGDLQEFEATETLPSLTGFRWRASERPTRSELLDQTILAAMKRFESY